VHGSAFNHRLAFGGATLFAAAGLGLAASSPVPGAPERAHAARGGRPNIVLIRTDDQTRRQLNRQTMPQTMNLLFERGTRFTRSVIATPQCCPSRGALLTGQYGHNNGVLSNTPGYPALRRKRNTLPVWLHRAGYRTAHFGKYLNGYTRAVQPRSAVAPGWDMWQTTFGDSSRYYDYPLSANGRMVRFGHRRRDYITRVLDRKATQFIHAYGPRRPLYLQIDHRAPHAADGTTKGRCSGSPPQPDARDMKRFSTTPLPTPPSFNEANVSDKPSFLRRRELDDTAIARMQLRYQCALASLRGVDRGVKRIYRAFGRLHELRRTVFIFTSDNGFFQGEHRIRAGKTLAYGESIRVPLVIRAPKAYRRGASRVLRVPEPVANIDLVPTILELAGARPCRAGGACRVLDGRSLVGLLSGDGSPWPSDRGILLEYRHRGEPRMGVCAYTGVHTSDRTYVEYTSAQDSGAANCGPTDARELYDFGSDPFELDNVADASAHESEVQQLSQRLARLKDCAGIAGRDRRVGGRPFCE
jgi:N-acetylglucosamine-6-sulfatase